MHQYINKHKLLFTVTAISFACSGFLSLVLAYSLKCVIDAASYQNMELFYQALSSGVIFMILNYLLTYIQLTLRAIFLKTTMLTIKEELFSALITQSLDTFKKENTAHYTSLFNNDLKLLEDDYFIMLFTIIEAFSDLLMSSVI